MLIEADIHGYTAALDAVLGGLVATGYDPVGAIERVGVLTNRVRARPR